MSDKDACLSIRGNQVTCNRGTAGCGIPHHTTHKAIREAMPEHTLTVYDHPEPHSHRWSDLEFEAIKRYAEAYARQAVEALRREPMTEWHRLDAARLNSEEFTGFYWLAMKGGEVAVGEYEWRQGWNPHGFHLIDGGRVCGTDVTHTMPFIRPELPNHITQKEQTPCHVNKQS